MTKAFKDKEVAYGEFAGMREMRKQKQTSWYTKDYSAQALTQISSTETSKWESNSDELMMLCRQARRQKSVLKWKSADTKYPLICEPETDGRQDKISKSAKTTYKKQERHLIRATLFLNVTMSDKTNKQKKLYNLYYEHSNMEKVVSLFNPTLHGICT